MVPSVRGGTSRMRCEHLVGITMAPDRGRLRLLSRRIDPWHAGSGEATPSARSQSSAPLRRKCSWWCPTPRAFPSGPGMPTGEMARRHPFRWPQQASPGQVEDEGASGCERTRRRVPIPSTCWAGLHQLGLSREPRRRRHAHRKFTMCMDLPVVVQAFERTTMQVPIAAPTCRTTSTVRCDDPWIVEREAAEGLPRNE